MREPADGMQALVHAARAVQLEAEVLLECVERRLIEPQPGPWPAEALEAARRVRRLRALGVNMQGLEVIFHMRRRMVALQQEVERTMQEMELQRRAHEAEVRRLLRELSRDA